MERHTKEIHIEEISFDEDGLNPMDKVGISFLIDWLHKQRKNGATYISIRGSSWGGIIDEINLYSCTEEIESDAVYNLRVKEEKEIITYRLELQREQEYQDYLRLKDKFE